MNRFRTTVGTLFLMAVAVTAAQAFSSQHKKVTLRVDGLACPFCAYGLEKKLKRLDGVEKLDIKINEGLVVLYFKKDATIDRALLEKKVKEAGFTPREITIDEPAPATTNGKATTKAREISLDIQGMACAGCVARVETALSKFDCISDVDVDLKTGVATVSCTEDKMDEQGFVEAVEKLGFKAKVVEKKGSNDR